MALFGKDAVLYWSTVLLDDSNTADSATWVEQDNIGDLTDTFTPTDVDITTRATAKLGWEATATVLKAGEIRFNMQVKHSDTFVTAIIDAFLNSTPIALMDLTAASTVEGAFGLASNFSVSWSAGKPVKGVQTMDVTLKVYSFPEWVTSEGS